MGVAGKGDGQLRGRGGVEGMGMVREQSGKSLRVAQRQQFLQGNRDGGVTVLPDPNLFRNEKKESGSQETMRDSPGNTAE